MKMTAGLRFLKQHKIAHDAREYDCRVKGAEYAAEALGWPVQQMAKTLVVKLGPREHCQVLMPGDRELSLKTLAREAGAKSATMTTPEEAEKLTGYLVGGIGPFGVRKAMPLWIDASLMDCERIGVNGGRRGLIVFLAPGDIVASLGARVVDLGT
ncbi:MAG: aminoacyl-tRNA deacylase [Deferrisomatales bacterium]|nr:aminoacyl-tRNA deacylase [Deferrisomatales bacterium]